MEKNKKIVKALAFLGFALVAINSIFGFGNANSTAYVQVLIMIVFAAIIIVSLLFTKDAEASLPVISSVALYISGLIIRSIIFFIDGCIDFVRSFRMDALLNERNYGKLNDEARTALTEKIEALREVIDKDLIGKIFDVICIVIAVSVAAFAIMSLINLLRKKDFAKTITGKFTRLIIASALKDKALPKTKNKPSESPPSSN